MEPSVQAGWDFAALKEDGSVVFWGSTGAEDASAAFAAKLDGAANAIFSDDGGVSAVKQDGTVVTWREPYYRVGSSMIAVQRVGGARAIFSSHHAFFETWEDNPGFAALRVDGSVVTWGGGDHRPFATDLRAP